MKKIALSGLFLIALVLITFCITAQQGLWPIRGTATPSQWEEKLGQSILSASLSRQAKGLTNPSQPSNEVLLAGQKIFKMNCAGCHGTPGQPSQWGTHGFYPRVPQLCDRPPALSSPQMFVAVKYGIRYSGMGAWEGMMSDDEIWKVATFLEHIGSLPPEIQANWKSAQ
jgi:mono/diheme cytochrome c family protein